MPKAVAGPGPGAPTDAELPVDASRDAAAAPVGGGSGGIEPGIGTGVALGAANERPCAVATAQHSDQRPTLSSKGDPHRGLPKGVAIEDSTPPVWPRAPLQQVELLAGYLLLQ